MTSAAATVHRHTASSPSPGAALVLGIDVGQSGAAALPTAGGDLVAVIDLPVLPDGPRSRPTISGALLAELLREWRPDRAFVELVTARPTDSRPGAFSFGMARGTIEATLAVLGIPQQSITVPTWKRAVGIPPGADQKSTARAEAIRRWPAHAASFARVRDDGRAEAALIALAGILKDKRQ